MDAVMLRGSLDQSSISPQKSPIRNPRKFNHHNPNPFISNHSNNFNTVVGLLQPPPPPPFRSHSYPPYSFQQPPLLPLPAANHRLSPAAVKKINGGSNRTRDTSLTPKKSKSPKKLGEMPSERVVIGSQNPGHLGPEPKGLPSNVAKVVINKPFVSFSGNNMFGGANNKVDLFSGAATFTISPPPSSLPLPTFSLMPKLSCRASAGIDAGATDDLRRLLRLR